MNTLIIPGFLGHTKEKTFEDLEKQLTAKGHNVIKLAWPYLPDNLEKYSFTETIKYAEEILSKLDMNETIILGFSMGGVIACYLAEKFKPKKLGLIVSPYQAGSEDDLAEKYKSWKDLGSLDFPSSRFGDLQVPFSFIEDARKYNALDYIANVSCPVLFIIGEKDEKVPNSVTKKLYDKANESKEWHLMKGMGHKYKYQPEMLERVNSLIVGFVGS